MPASVKFIKTNLLSVDSTWIERVNDIEKAYSLA